MRIKSERVGAFTIIELLAAIAVLMLILAAIAGMAAGVNKAWVSGEKTTESSQGGRAILELITRELSQAVISPKLQLVDSPTLPSSANQRGSNSLFWVAPLAHTTQGDLCEIGYFLTNNSELKRFFVAPDDTTNYRIFDSNYAPRATGRGFGMTDPYDHANAALWATNTISSTNPKGQLVTSTVAGGILNFFVRCLDCNGDPIPWLDKGLKYNSCEPALSAKPGARNDPQLNQGNPSSFLYTYYNADNQSDTSNTAAGNLLPHFVELTIVTTDVQTLRRLGNNKVPATPPVSLGTRLSYPPGVDPAAPMAIPNVVLTFQQDCINNGFRNARVFSTVVRLQNAGR